MGQECSGRSGEVDDDGVYVSVLIPTRSRPERLAACVAALADQTLDEDRIEVLVGLDGPDHAAARAARAAWTGPSARPGALRIVECPGAGYIDVRHRLLDHAAGDVLVSLNDDVVPEPDFLAVHAREQASAQASGWPAVIVGHSPFARPARPTLLDRIVDETSLIFFYDTMRATAAVAADPDRNWGYRHCFGLNFSAPLAQVRRAGGIPSVPDTYGYDDIELGFRLARLGLPVLYRPAARAVHHHRYRPRDVLRREYRLGVAAARYARVNRTFTRALFGRDLTAADEVAASRAFLRRERASATRLERSFHRLARSAGAGDDVRGAYERHRPLKRFVWRQGLVRELEGREEEYAPVGALAGSAT
jgi:GT2 family glycosyltransferase